MHEAGQRRAIILLVEDDPGDQELTSRAFRNDALEVDLRIVSDGEEAMSYLLHRDEYACPDSAPMPDLILLDLNMPRMNGKQVLEQVSHEAELRRIPIVVLTTSQGEQDILESYDLGCNSFVTKPVDMDGFTKCIRELGSYWFELATIPTRTR